jgi:hypothetical protein
MTKEINFDFSTYVTKNATALERRSKEEKPRVETSRMRRRKVMRVVSKVASVAREVLDIYSAVKRKDPISVALGALSTYGCVSEIFEHQPPQAQERLKELGASKVFPMMCSFIFHTLQQMDVPVRRIWNSEENKDDGDNSQEGIEEFNLGDNFKVWFINSGNGAEGSILGPYVMDVQEFVGRFAAVLEEKLGKVLTINTIVKGWDELYYLGPLAIPTSLYICHIDEDSLMTRIENLQKLGFNRSLLFFGPPGIGKTTLAAKLSERIGGRLLVASCGTLESGRGRSIIEDLVDIIDPSVVLLDDIDKMWRPSEMLESMEKLNRKVSKRKRLLIGTVNSLSEIPEPLRRPGRFDEIVEFYPLTTPQRKNILTNYANEFKVEYTDREWNTLAKQTEGLTGAYLKEIAKRASVVPFIQMCEQIKQIKRICNMVEEEEEAPSKRRKKRKGGMTASSTKKNRTTPAALRKI